MNMSAMVVLLEKRVVSRWSTFDGLTTADGRVLLTPGDHGEDRPLRAVGEAPGQGREILLIEDDASLALMYRRALERSGHQVTVASDGEQGLRLATSVDFDAVVLDVGLPKVDGLDVLAAIRAVEEHADLPVIVLSNYNEPYLIERARRLGALAYRVKAHTMPSDLVRILRERFPD
jgi:CheY-like chemotaxis protein